MAARLSPASLYAHERASVLIPLPFLSLPADLQMLGRAWRRKSEMHVTAANTTSIAERIRAPLAIDADAAEDAVWTALSDASHDCAVGEVVLSSRYMHVRRDEHETLIILCGVEGLDDLYRYLGERLGTRIEPPPTHVTLYTIAGGESIGLHIQAELDRDSVPLGAREAHALDRMVAEATSPG